MRHQRSARPNAWPRCKHEPRTQTQAGLERIWGEASDIVSDTTLHGGALQRGLDSPVRLQVTPPHAPAGYRCIPSRQRFEWDVPAGSARDECCWRCTRSTGRGEGLGNPVAAASRQRNISTFPSRAAPSAVSVSHRPHSTRTQTHAHTHIHRHTRTHAARTHTQAHTPRVRVDWAVLRTFWLRQICRR